MSAVYVECYCGTVWTVVGTPGRYSCTCCQRLVYEVDQEGRFGLFEGIKTYAGQRRPALDDRQVPGRRYG